MNKPANSENQNSTLGGGGSSTTGGAGSQSSGGGGGGGAASGGGGIIKPKPGIITHDDIARIRGLLDCYQLAPGGEVADGLLAEVSKILATYQSTETPHTALVNSVLAGATINDITEREHKPAGDDWIEWSGGECPVEKGTLIDVRYRDGREITRLQALVNDEGRDASSRFWDNDGMENDIIAYRLSQQEIGTV